MKTFFKPILWFFFFSFLIIHVSCSKTDHFIITEKINSSSLEKRFFSEHRSNSNTEMNLVGFLERENQKNKFVEQTVKQIGFPRWNKLMTQPSQNSSNIQSNTNEDGNTYYIPFVRDSASVVNAVMIINTNNTDTSINYLCDWQYNDTLTTGISSRAHSLLLINLDRNVFGDRLYKISDTLAFGQNEQQKFVKYIKLINDNNSPNNLMVSVTITFCYEYWTDSYQGQVLGCPPGPSCPNWISAIRCENYTYWAFIEEGGGSSGGGTGTGGTGGSPGGGGSGSGGTGGGSAPPPCGQIPVPLMKDQTANQSNIVNPCGGTGWTPVPTVPLEEPPTTFDLIATTLNLNSSEISWLLNNQVLAQEISNFLSNSQSSVNPITYLSYYPLANPKAVAAARSFIQIAILGSAINKLETAEFNILISNLPSPQNQTLYNPMWGVYFAIECINIKAEHPEWSNARVYLEASIEVVHVLLDGAGLIPVIGEIADLANGAIYSIQGDGINASLSFAAAIPVAGWTATAAKYAKKVVTALDNSKRTLKWYSEANGIINFGDRGLLRKVLGLAKGDPRVAHHLIPWEFSRQGIIQKAGGADFNMNEVLNGIPVSVIQHNSGGHSIYNEKIRLKLVDLTNRANAQNWNSNQCASAVRNLANDLSSWITTHPNESINNIIIP